MPGAKSRKTNKRAMTNRIARPMRQPRVPVGAIAYKGPIVFPDNDTTIVSLLDNATIIVSAGGALLANFNTLPTSSRNWSEYSTSWAEYRVLGIKFSYDPIAAVNTASAPGFSGYHCTYHGATAPAPTTLAQAASTGVAKPWNAFKRFVREWRMQDPEEALFQPCASPSSTSYALTLYAEGGGVSQYYGNLLIQYLVQFRTHTL
jgi:hypothetical protein